MQLPQHLMDLPLLQLLHNIDDDFAITNIVSLDRGKPVLKRTQVLLQRVTKLTASLVRRVLRVLAQVMVDQLVDVFQRPLARLGRVTDLGADVLGGLAEAALPVA